VVRAAAAHDLAVEPLGQHAVAPRPPALLLGYARLPEPALAEAATRLRRALASAG
jgi:DNA-binding transcriptional MocR family regulator